MTADEIIQMVKANVGKSVVLKFDSGEVMTAVVVTVDVEGLVYDPDPLETRETKPLYWTPFLDVAEVRPDDKC